MLELRADINKEKNQEKAAIYKKIEKYILDCSFTKKGGNSKLTFYLMNGYKYPEIARILNRSESGIRSRTTDYSNTLYKYFGDDFFDLMSDYTKNKVEIAKRCYIVFNTGENIRAMYVPTYILKYIEGNKNLIDLEKCDMASCRDEIEFLIENSIPVVESKIKDLDPDKLEYVLKVLEAKTGSIEDRYNITRLMSGN